jgi:hypothetical protein
LPTYKQWGGKETFKASIIVGAFKTPSSASKEGRHVPSFILGGKISFAMDDN